MTRVVFEFHLSSPATSSGRSSACSSPCAGTSLNAKLTCRRSSMALTCWSRNRIQHQERTGEPRYEVGVASYLRTLCKRDNRNDRTMYLNVNRNYPQAKKTAVPQ